MLRLALATLALAVALPVGAQGFPSKPIRLICPFPPAGAVDIASRAIAHELTRLLGQTVTVENRPGAGGNLGGEAAVRSAPDGYTLFMTTSGIQAINPSLYGAQMKYDPNRELAPVAPLVTLNNVLVVHPTFPAHSLKEFTAYVKANPGKVDYASSGPGTTIHLSAELFKQMTGTFMVHIPYKGSAPAVTDLLAGQVRVMFDNIPSALPHIRSGKLRPLGVTGSKRHPQLPDVPTIAEAGVPGYEAAVWFGLSVPAATPREIIGRINAAAAKGAQSPEFVKRMTDLGYEIIAGTPEKMAEMLKAELAKWPKVVAASGAKVD